MAHTSYIGNFLISFVFRYLNNLKHLRIKDIERIILTLYQFNYDSKETVFYSQAADELLKPYRVEERQL
jgi:predicted AlkP superfamily phosphohydrolase/phosphomutase